MLVGNITKNIFLNIFIHLNVGWSFNKLLPANRHESCSVLGRGRHNKYKAKMMIKDWHITDENGGDGNNFKLDLWKCIKVSMVESYTD